MKEKFVILLVLQDVYIEKRPMRHPVLEGKFFVDHQRFRIIFTKDI